MKFWWGFVASQGLFGLVALVWLTFFSSAPAIEQAANAAIIVAWSVVPYVIARALQAEAALKREAAADAAARAAAAPLVLTGGVTPVA